MITEKDGIMDDDELLQAVIRGDTRAFDLLFLRCQPRLLMFITRFVKDEEVARDICQDIFLKLWADRSSLSNVRSTGRYLFGMAHHAIYNLFEHRQVERRHRDYVAGLADTADAGPEERLLADQLRELLQLAVSNMPEQRRRVWRMSREEHLDNGEIARRLNITRRTVENHLSNALRELRKTARAARMLLAL